MWWVKPLCVVIGYACGCFLTADIVARKVIGKSAFDIGSCNPGMANVASQAGVGPAAVVLLGDIAKTMLACWLCWFLFMDSGRVVILYAGCGVTIGHNFPFWTRFRGGKGVATTCTAIFCFDPLWGLLACIVGLIVSAASKYLPYGAIAIPVSFLIPTYPLYGLEATLLVLFLSLMMLSRHWRPMRNAMAGNEPQVDLIGQVRERLGKKGRES